MPKANFRSSLTPALLALMDRDIVRDDDLAPLIDRWHAHHDPADRQALFEAYVPWVRVLALRLARRVNASVGDIADMIADGCVGLFEAIASHQGDGVRMYTFVRTGIRWRIIRGLHDRSPNGRHVQRQRRIVEGVRAQFIQQHGRTPLTDELAERLRGMIGNPDFYASGEAHTIHVGGLDNVARERCEPIDTRESPAEQHILDRETIRIALRELKPKDLAIFKMLLKGDSDAEIARKLGVSRQRIGQRMNGVLWEARARADLAAYLGVVPKKLSKEERKRGAPSPASYGPAPWADDGIHHRQQRSAG